jgi:iron(III) transport system substrate-binding protein
VASHWPRAEKIFGQTKQQRREKEDEKQIICPAGSHTGGNFGAGLCRASPRGASCATSSGASSREAGAISRETGAISREAGASSRGGFTDKYPFIEMKGMDMNTTKTVNRVVLEYKAARPSTDVVEVGDDGLSTLAALGALQKPEVPFPHMKDFDPRLQPASGLFVTVFASARAQGAYNSDMVPPDEVPTTWDMMTDPKWTGNTIISASGEDMPLTLASLWAEDGKLNWDRSFDFWGKLFQQEPIITKGYRRGNEQLASGERAFFWFTAIQPAVRMYLDEGAPVGIMAWPTLPTSFRPLGITKGAPHPAAAWLLIDYVMSPEGQFECTERGEVLGGFLPLNKNAKPGRHAQYVMEKGITQANTNSAYPEFTLDGMTNDLYTPENVKKSEDWFLEQMGVR